MQFECTRYFEYSSSVWHSKMSGMAASDPVASALHSIVSGMAASDPVASALSSPPTSNPTLPPRLSFFDTPLLPLQMALGGWRPPDHEVDPLRWSGGRVELRGYLGPDSLEKELKHEVMRNWPPSGERAMVIVRLGADIHKRLTDHVSL